MTSARRRAQSGSVLLLVLAAIALTSVVLVALLGLSMASGKLTSAQDGAARDRRASDAALETGIARLSRSVANNPCADVPPSSNVEFAGERDAAGNPIEVELRCRPLPLPTQTAPNTPSPEVLGGPGVEIVGDSYGGRLTVPSGGVANSTLVAQGADPLRFDADVTVKRSANVRSSVAGNVAASVAGQYEQGLAGDGATPAARCGTLDPAGGAVQSSVRDRDAVPRCESSTAAALAPRSGTLYSASEGISERTVDPCPHPSTASVIEFQQGRYDAVDTARLNDLLNGSCRNKTFWFRPGKYLFDVNDASALTAPGTVDGDRFALLVDDPTAKVVFGANLGWTAPAGATAANFPRACDVAQSGASVQLTGRSTIRHRQGRVSICPFFNPATNSPMPAVVQGDSSPSQPILVSDTLPVNRRLSTTTFCVDWLFCDTATLIRSFSTTWASAGTAPLDSAVFLVQITESPPVHQAKSYIRLRVRNTALGISCWVGHMVAGRTHGQYIAVDMMANTAAGQCGDVLRSRPESVFEGATINVEMWVEDREPGACGLPPGCPISFNLGKVAMRTNMVGVPATTATSSSWATPTGALTLGDGASARVAQNVCPLLPGDVRCADDLAATNRSITVGGFQPPPLLLEDDEPVEHLGVRLESPDTGLSWASDQVDGTWVRVDLTLPAFGSQPQRTCSVTEQGFARSSRAVHVDLFPEGGTCRSLVQWVGELRNASVEVSIRSDCMWFGASRAPIIGGRCNQVRLPEFDRIQLDVTAALLQRAPSAQVAIGAATGEQSTFNVFGDTIIPRLDLDLRWRGAVTDLPVFGGVMSVRSLGSTQDTGATMGVVCCSPPAVTTVLLEAMIDSVVQAETSLYVGRPGSAAPAAERRRLVSVRDWTYCEGACTEVMSASTVPSPPPGP